MSEVQGYIAGGTPRIIWVIPLDLIELYKGFCTSGDVWVRKTGQLGVPLPGMETCSTERECRGQGSANSKNVVFLT